MNVLHVFFENHESQAAQSIWANSHWSRLIDMRPERKSHQINRKYLCPVNLTFFLKLADRAGCHCDFVESVVMQHTWTTAGWWRLRFWLLEKHSTFRSHLCLVWKNIRLESNHLKNKKLTYRKHWECWKHSGVSLASLLTVLGGGIDLEQGTFQYQYSLWVSPCTTDKGGAEGESGFNLLSEEGWHSWVCPAALPGRTPPPPSFILSVWLVRTLSALMCLSCGHKH